MLEPWQVTDRPNDACCWSYHVETVRRDTPGYAAEGIADVRMEAHAHMISAIPEFMELCRVIMEEAETTPSHLIKQLGEMAKTALEKANGPKKSKL
jgi:hypothetical protein